MSDLSVRIEKPYEVFISECVTMLEEAFTNMVFSTEKERIWRESLIEFPRETITIAMAECIESCTFPPALAEVRKVCNRITRNEKIAERAAKNLPPEPDPFEIDPTAPDLISRALGASNGTPLNNRMLRVAVAWLGGQKAEGVEKPVPLTSDQDQVCRGEIESFHGLTHEQIYKRCKQLFEVSN